MNGDKYLSDIDRIEDNLLLCINGSVLNKYSKKRN